MDQRKIKINGREIVELNIADTFIVFIDGLKVDMSYLEAIEMCAKAGR